MINISIYSKFIWLIAFVALGLALLTFLTTKRLSSRAFSISLFFACIWMVGVGLLISTKNIGLADFLSRFNYFEGTLIAASFLYFFLVFPNDKKPNNNMVRALILLELLFFYLYFFTNSLIYGSSIFNSPSVWKWNFGNFSYSFELFFLGSFLFGLSKLYRYNQKKYLDKKMKDEVYSILLIIFFGSVPPFLASIIMPRFGYFDLNWLGPISAFFWITIMTYCITKQKIFSIKFLTIEISIFILWLVIMMYSVNEKNIHLTRTDVGMVLGIILLSILVIRGIVHEIQQRKQITHLSLELENACTQLRELGVHIKEDTIEDVSRN